MENQAIVIDNGSDMVKAGFSGDQSPYYEFPCVVGVPKYQKTGFNMDFDKKDEYIGDHA